MALSKGPKLDWSILASVDLSASKYKFVKFHGTATDDSVIACAAATDLPLGVLNNAPAAGQESEVVLFGIVKIVCGGTITRNDNVGPDATGAAVTRIYLTDATKYICGRALESGTVGQIISVAVNLPTAFLAK